MPWKKGNRLRFVPEEIADPATRQIYSHLKRALGVPALRLFYPALGVYPEFLNLHWELMKPVLESQQFFDCAGRLRADAYTRAHNYYRIPDICASLSEARLSVAARQELTATIDLFHHRDSLLLLLFSAQIQAMEGPTGRSDKEPKVVMEQDPPVSWPVLVEEENAPASVRKKYDEIRRAFDLPFINSEYMAMARFPDFLSAYWDLLKKLMGSPLYDECQYGLRETAWHLARELPGPLELSMDQLLAAGIEQDDIASVARILELFVKNLSGLVLNVAVAKIALEGGNLHLSPEKQTTNSDRVA